MAPKSLAAALVVAFVCVLPAWATRPLSTRILPTVTRASLAPWCPRRRRERSELLRVWKRRRALLSSELMKEAEDDEFKDATSGGWGALAALYYGGILGGIAALFGGPPAGYAVFAATFVAFSSSEIPLVPERPLLIPPPQKNHYHDGADVSGGPAELGKDAHHAVISGVYANAVPGDPVVAGSGIRSGLRSECGRANPAWDVFRMFLGITAIVGAVCFCLLLPGASPLVFFAAGGMAVAGAGLFAGGLGDRLQLGVTILPGVIPSAKGA